MHKCIFWLAELFGKHEKARVDGLLFWSQHF
jgi:hypothetical protein